MVSEVLLYSTMYPVMSVTAGGLMTKGSQSTRMEEVLMA